MKLLAAPASCLVLLALAFSPAAAVAEAVDATDPGSVLEEVLAPYRQLQGLHYRAHYAFTFWDAEGRESYGESSAEYWGSPQGFRSETEVDRRLTRAGFLGATIVTYDGLESRLLFRSEGSLSLRRGEMSDISITPNPIFLPIDFVKVTKIDCGLCRATLADIRAAAPAAAYIPQGASVRASPDAQEAVLVSLPSGDEGGQKEISLARWQGAWFVAEVVQRDGAGAMTIRNRFSFPLEVSGASAGFVPASRVVMEAWAKDGDFPNGLVRMEIRGEITHLDVTPSFLWSDFTIPIDTELAQTVVDDDSGRVLRGGSCKVSLPERPNPFDAP